MKRSEAKYLADMLQYAQEALDIAQQLDAEQFFGDRKIQLALSHLVQIIGEAAFHTSDATRTALPDVPPGAKSSACGTVSCTTTGT